MEVATRVQFCDPNQIVYVGLPPSGLGHVTLTEIITTQTDQGLSSQFDPSFEASANIIAGFVSNEKCNSDMKCIPFFFKEALMVWRPILFFFTFFFTFILYSWFFLSGKNTITLKNGKLSAHGGKKGETRKKGETMASSVALKNRESKLIKKESWITNPLALVLKIGKVGSRGCHAWRKLS